MLPCPELKTMITITYMHPYNHPKFKLCTAIKPYVFHLKNKPFTKINCLMHYIFCLMPYVLYAGLKSSSWDVYMDLEISFNVLIIILWINCFKLSSTFVWCYFVSFLFWVLTNLRETDDPYDHYSFSIIFLLKAKSGKCLLAIFICSLQHSNVLS